MAEDEHLQVPGAEGWRYRPLARNDDGSHAVTLVSDDGEEIAFVVPSFVERGEELGEIARIVLRAHERWRRLEGLGA